MGGEALQKPCYDEYLAEFQQWRSKTNLGSPAKGLLPKGEALQKPCYDEYLAEFQQCRP